MRWHDKLAELHSPPRVVVQVQVIETRLRLIGRLATAAVAVTGLDMQVTP